MAVNEPPDRDGMTPADGGARGVPGGCPDAERLAEYADGLLDPASRAAIEAHLVTCPDCRFAIVETMEFIGAVGEVEGEAEAGTSMTSEATTATSAVEEAAAPEVRAQVTEQPPQRAAQLPTQPEAKATASQAPDAVDSGKASDAPARVVPFRKRSWVTGVGAALAAAAALVLIVRIADPAWLPSFLGGGPRLEELVAALETQAVRPVEGRLMGGGGFSYARPPSPTRGGGPDKLGRKWSSEVDLAAAEILRDAEGNTSGRARAAVGVALIVEGDLDAAIVALQEAAKDRPDDAAIQNNLSAAYLARAQSWNHPEDWQKAYVAAGRAIKLEPYALEPRFNHALAIEGLERNGLVPEGFYGGYAGDLAQTVRPSFKGAGARAWADYVSRDRDSAWTREAEDRRKALSAH